MDDKLRKAFFAVAAPVGIKADINGTFFGLVTGEEIYNLFKTGMLTCAFCGHVSPDRIRHKYHQTLYCEAAQHAHHAGE